MLNYLFSAHKDKIMILITFILIVIISIVVSELHYLYILKSNDLQPNISIKLTLYKNYSYLLLGIIFIVVINFSIQKIISLARQSQIGFRFQKALDLLSSDKESQKLMGIYNIEKLGFDSERDKELLTELLIEFLNKFSGKDKDMLIDVEDENFIKKIRVDNLYVYNLATVKSLSRLNKKYNLSLNLSSSEFSGYDLNGIDLSQAILRSSNFIKTDLNSSNLKEADISRANLRYSDFFNSNLENSNLSHSNLKNSNFVGANLKGANLYNANIAGANFEVANLESANLIEADLSDTNISGANLKSANLTSAKNLTKEQIESAVTDDNTKLPDYLI